MNFSGYTQTFAAPGDFEASRAAEAWCKARGISVGHTQGPEPRGLLIGDFDVQKWRNLRPSERAELDGQMTGDMRHGPVVVTLKERAAVALGLWSEGQRVAFDLQRVRDRMDPAAEQRRLDAMTTEEMQMRHIYREFI